MNIHYIKTILITCICSVFLFCCDQPSKKKQDSKTHLNNGFTITGNLNYTFTKTVFLNKIIENTLYAIDSSEVLNNTFNFKGIVEKPERFVLTFENYASSIILIIENSDIQLQIDSKQINDPIITGSKLNFELNEYKTASKKIFKKIEYLFPQFQKARLENDPEKLEIIGLKMKKIETEFTDYSFNYIQKNSDSYISALILRDQLKASKIDTLKIRKHFKLLSENLKESPDGEILKTFLNLH